MNINEIVNAAKARRESAGLRAIYQTERGELVMFHPTEAHKAFYDLKYALKAEYPTEADLPDGKLAELKQLAAALR